MNGKLDAFVCGSDQIWAPSCYAPHYFFDFVHNPDKMIVYTPSIGLQMIDDKEIEQQVKHYALRFRYISTREVSGSKFVSDLIGRPVETV